MAFDNTLFPTGVSYGSDGGPGFKTRIVAVASGAEERVSEWTDPRHQYNAAYRLRSYEDAMKVKRFIMARGGALRSFRWKDWTDYTSNQDGRTAQSKDDVSIGLGDGSEVNFQLIKTYIDEDGFEYDRTITKPVAGTVAIALDTVTQVEGVDFTVNALTGLVTFTTAPGPNVDITAGYEFDVHVRFSSGVDEFMRVTVDTFDSVSIPALDLVEVINEAPVYERRFFGGSTDHGNISADMSITMAEGLLQVFDPQSAGLNVDLPPAADVKDGVFQFVIVNDSDTNTFNLRNSAGTQLVVVGTESTVILCMSESSGTKTWRAAS